MADHDGLLQKAIAGDRAALEELLAGEQDRVYRFGLRLCGDPDAADEVLQETLLAAARGLPDFRQASSLSTWLYTIARSFCIKRRRKSKFAPAHVEPLEAARDVGSAAPDPEAALEAREAEQAVARAVAELPPDQREVLVLRDVEGLTAPEVAEVTGASVAAVKSRLHRARAALRARLVPFDEAAARAPGEACPDVIELFSRHLEGEIDAGACRKMEEHLARCPRCTGACDALRRTLAACSRARDAAVPPSVAVTVRRALHDFLAPR